MIDPATAAELEQLAARIARIRPMSNSNPHAFYEERSEVASEIRRLASTLRSGVKPAHGADEPPAPVKPGRVVGRETRHIAGRTIHVLIRQSATERALP